MATKPIHDSDSTCSTALHDGESVPATWLISWDKQPSLKTRMRVHTRYACCDEHVAHALRVLGRRNVRVIPIVRTVL